MVFLILNASFLKGTDTLERSGGGYKIGLNSVLRTMKVGSAVQRDAVAFAVAAVDCLLWLFI